jgi:hypothetical protein
LFENFDVVQFPLIFQVLLEEDGLRLFLQCDMILKVDRKPAAYHCDRQGLLCNENSNRVFYNQTTHKSSFVSLGNMKQLHTMPTAEVKPSLKTTLLRGTQSENACCHVHSLI